MFGRNKNKPASSGGPDNRVEVEAVYQVHDNTLMSGELRQAVVKSNGMQISEVREALADKHDASVRNVEIVKWRRK